MENRYLKEVMLDEGLEKIGKYTFSGSSIETVSIPGSVKKIGTYYFAGCTVLKAVDNHASLDVIPDGLFSNCISLKELNLGSAVKEIHKSPFYNCPALLYIGENNQNFKTVKGVLYSKDIYEDGYERYDRIKGCSKAGINLKNITVEKGNKYFKSKGGVLFNYKMTKLYSFPRAREGDYIIPKGVKIIEEDAFAGASNLKKLTVTSGIKYAGINVANCSSLNKIVFEEGVGSIYLYGGTGACYPGYSDGINVEKVYFPSTLHNISIKNMNKTVLFYAYGNTGSHSGEEDIKSTKNYITNNGYLCKNLGTAPGKVCGLSAIMRKQKVKLSWKKPVKNADGYLIVQHIASNGTNKILKKLKKHL